jgi:RimJ/RimL family protein N-acetyltransferase
MFARTERLLLRPGWAEDAPALHAAIADEGIVRNLALVPWPYEPCDARAFLAAERDADEPNLLIFRRTSGAPRLVGGIALTRRPDGHELGYWLARSAWGLGYATEAGHALVAHARDALRLKRLCAAPFLDNPGSARVLEKLGFRSTGSVSHRYSAGRRSSVPTREFVLALRRDAECDNEEESRAPLAMMAA